MAFYITRPSTLIHNKTVYYVGGSQWSDDTNNKKLFDSEQEANSLLNNENGKNGGFKLAQVVEE